MSQAEIQELLIDAPVVEEPDAPVVEEPDATAAEEPEAPVTPQSKV